MEEKRLRLSSHREKQMLSATLEVLGEVGYGRFTIDAVAARARASKTTVYRRWPTKAQLVAAAFRASIDDAPDHVDHGHLRDDVVALLTGLRIELERYRDIIADLVGELHRSPELSAAIREYYVNGRQEAVRIAFERAQRRGEVAADRDLTLLWQIGPAVLFYRMLLADELVDEGVIQELAGLICTAGAATAPQVQAAAAGLPLR